MPTETELRLALNHLADQAPRHCGTDPRAGRRRRRARRALVPALTAAIVAVTALAVPAVLHAQLGPTRHSPQAARQSPQAGSTHPGAALSPARLPVTGYLVRVDPVAGLTAEDMFTAPGAQQVSLDEDGRLYAVVTVYAPGGWVPPRAAGAVDVTVAGRPGFYGDTEYSATGVLDAASSQQHRGDDAHRLHGALAWQYRPGAWAVVSRFVRDTADPPLSRAQALRLAEAVHVGDTLRPATVPARFGHLPDGLQLQGVQTYPTPALRLSSASPSDTTTSYAPASALSFGPSGTDEVTLTVGISADGGDGVPKAGASVRIGRFHGSYTADLHDLELTDGTIALDLSGLVDDGHGPRLTTEPGDTAPGLDEMTRIVRAMSFATSINDRATWFPVSTALR